MASQAYTHKTLLLKCWIHSDQRQQDEVIVRNPSTNDLDKNLQTLLTKIIPKKFKFLSNMDESEWTICINSQFIDKTDGSQFSSILSTIPPQHAVVDIMRATLTCRQCGSSPYIIIVHHNNQHFPFELTGDKEDWTDNQQTWDKLQSAISNQFDLYSTTFSLYEDVDGTKVNIDDMDDIVAAFDDAHDSQNIDEGKHYPIHIFVKIDSNNNMDLRIGESQWQYRNDNGTWTNYSKHNSVLIELAYKDGDDSVGITKNNIIYDIRTKQNVECDFRTNKSRPIRRVQLKQALNIDDQFDDQFSDKQRRRLLYAERYMKSHQESISYQLPEWDLFKITSISDNDDTVAIYDSDVSIEEIKDDGEHPVLPLIIPNNCSYDPNTGKMTVDDSKPRYKLVLYEPALEFIRKIGSKIATISIAGRARTGKSLIAGELYAPQKIPCPFDLGHTMDACTYGIWVSAKPIKHPHCPDTVILIFDVEGTGFHQSRKHNDMQLMVITLLISSYFIYNSKGAFDAAALDEIKFVLDLTKNIHSAPSNIKEEGTDFKKFFPIFMWLLRDVQLAPIIDHKLVSIRQYFTQRVLSSEQHNVCSLDQNELQTQFQRQACRQVFLQMFQKYDAFALPIPHMNENILKKLGFIARSKLQPQFNEKLKEFCDKVLKDTKCKTLFSKDVDGEDQYIHCTGTHLSGWIEQCLESVNSDKIPQVISMADTVMADVFRVAKKKAIKQYRKLLDKGLIEERKNDNEMPLDESEIIQLHLNIYNKVLNSKGNCLQPTRIVDDDDVKCVGPQQIITAYSEFSDEEDEQFVDYSNDKPQIKVFREFCDAIGHHQDITKIGRKGIMYRRLTENYTLSTDFCKKTLKKYFMQNIDPMLQQPQRFEAKDIFNAFTELENKYYKQCKGPSKNFCWKEFESKTKHESIQRFKQIKGISEQLLKAERESAKIRKENKKIKQIFDKRKKELELQHQSLKEELARIERAREIQSAEHDKKLKEAEQRLNDIKKSQFNKLAQTVQQNNDEWNLKLVEMERKSKQEMAATIQRFNQKIEKAAKAKPKTVIHAAIGLLPYTPIFSEPLITHHFEDLISDDATKGAVCVGHNSFIEAHLGGLKFVTHIEIKGIAVQGFCGNNHNLYPCIVQYRDSNNQWVTLGDFTQTYMPNNFITTISLSKHALSVRVFSDDDDENSHALCGTLRIFGCAASPAVCPYLGRDLNQNGD